MSEIYVKDGWLYKDNSRLKLEFGNLEQIAAIRKYEKYVKQIKEGIEPECSYEVKGNVGFKCICGFFITVDDIEADFEGDIECFEDIQRTCRNCNKKYKFVVERKYGILAPGRRYLQAEKLLVRLKDHE
jgi:hypothetical protein